MQYLILLFSVLLFTTSFAQKEDPIVDFPDVEAEYIGGSQAMKAYLIENTKYPKKALMNNETGKVYVSFCVERDGTVSNVEVIKSSGSIALDNEAIRVVRAMPKWKPGEKDGYAVRSPCRIPINFEITNSKKKKKKWFRRRN